MGAVAGFVFGILSIAVLTRLLSLAEFGRLALLLFFAAMLTLFYNAPSLQGTLMRVFGAGDDESGEIEDDEALASDKRKALTTGLTVTVATVLVGTAVVAASAGTI